MRFNPTLAGIHGWFAGSWPQQKCDLIDYKMKIDKIGTFLIRNTENRLWRAIFA